MHSIHRENQTTIHPTLFETYKGLDSHQKYLQHLCLKVMLVSAGASQHQLTGTLLEDDMGFYLIISCLERSRWVTFWENKITSTEVTLMTG